MSAKNSQQSGGIGFIGLLTIVFITLKLTGFVKWSWIWVLFPIWTIIACVIALLLICVVVEAIYGKRGAR